MKIRTTFEHAVREIENLWIELSDGCKLAARVWLPADTDAKPVPAILEYIPYRKRDYTTGRDEPLHHYLAGHGYAAVRVDMRGAGDSEGQFQDEYTQRELEDAVEVIAWLAAQPWCSGAVGMMGNSWGGFNALQVAALRPPALKAIITSCSTDDRYADDMHYMGGCLLNDNMDWGTTFLGFLGCPPDPAISGERWRSLWRARLEQVVDPVALWLHHQRRDEYWRHGSICEDYSRITCAVLAVGGWLDGYSNAIPRMLANLTCPRQGIIGPWAHSYPHMGVPGPGIGFLQEAVRWWDRWLKGSNDGRPEAPMLRAFMGRGTPPSPFYATAPGRWIAERSWPAAAITTGSWFLSDGRLAETSGPDSPLTTLSPLTTGLAAGEWCPFGTGGKGPEFPGDQREDDGRSLTFDSPPLDRPIEILGAPSVTLDLAVDRPGAFVVARLCDVSPTGGSTRISYGALNLARREGLDKTVPVRPGERYRVTIQLNDAGYSFQPGHRLRLALSTAYWPMIWPSPAPVTLRVHTAGCRLDLPVRPTETTAYDAAALAEPEQGPPSRRVALREGAWENWVRKDTDTGRVTVGAKRDDGIARVESSGIEFGSVMSEEIGLTEGDPLSATTRMSRVFHIGRGDWRTRIEAETALAGTATHFQATARLTAYEGETVIFDRAWSEEIPRDGI